MRCLAPRRGVRSTALRVPPALWAILAAASGCFDAPNYEGLACGPNAPCPIGFTCTEALSCTRRPFDDAGALPTDAGARDGAPSPPDGGAGPIDSGAEAPDATSPPDAGVGGDAAALREISGVRLQRFVSESGEVERPVDLSGTPVSALTRSASGTFTVHPGMGASDGAYSIPGVPAGRYWLRVGGLYLDTSSRDPDLGLVTAGRPGGVEADQLGTQLTLELTGLTPWQLDHQLMVVVAGGNGFDWGAENRLVAPLLAGATSIDGALLDWTEATSPVLIEAAAGDRAYVTQLVREQSTTMVGHSVLDAIAAAQPLTMTEGQSSVLSGVFTRVQRSRTLELTLRRAAFDAHRADVSPTARASEPWTVRVIGQAGASAYGRLTRQPTILFNFNLAAGNTDLELGALTYGNPIPAWEEVGSVTVGYEVEYTLGASLPFVEEAVLYNYVPAAELPAALEGPAISPVIAPTIAGISLFSPASGVGLTPTLSWRPPSIGTASGYVVSVYRLTEVVGLTLPDLEARLYTTQETIHLPPGVLIAGESYYLRIQAVARAAASFESAPFRRTLPESGADVLSAVFTP